MSKKRFKNKRLARKKVHHIARSPLDRHHIFYIGRKWSAGYLAELRNFHYCIVLIPRDTLHRYIHEEIATIHPPKPINAKEALNHLRLLEQHGAINDGDDIEKRLKILIALFDCVELSTTDGLRQQLKIVRKFKNKPP